MNINRDLNIPVSLYKEMNSIKDVTPEYGYHYHDVKYTINKKEYDEKSSIWNKYIKTSSRDELLPIGSIITNSSDKWPRRAYVIIDIDFRIWGNKPQLTEETTEVPFRYRLMDIDNIDSLDDFIETGEIHTTEHFKFSSISSNISAHCEQFDSLVCSSIEDFSETYKRQLKEIKNRIIGKHFIGWNAYDANIYDESHSMFTLKIKDVRLHVATMGFELIPENGITVINRRRKYEGGTLGLKFHNDFVKCEKDKLRSPVLCYIDPKDNKLKFPRGFVYSDKNSINYVANIFRSAYKYAEYNIGINYNRLKKDEFIMPVMTYADETVKVVEKYKEFLKKKYIQWDYQMKGKAIKDFADNGKQHWVLFDDSSFVVQKSRVVKKETYYTTVNSSAMERFGSIHGFFQALTSKKDELNAAGKMFVDCKVFTKEEIISMSKSSL